MVGEGNTVYKAAGERCPAKKKHGREGRPVEDTVGLTERTILLPKPGAERASHQVFL